MTIGAVLDAMGTRELRANLRAIVEKVEAGTPVVCLKDGQPLAVMISHEDAERWRKIEDSLATLHALDVYPEALADPSELADIASLKPPDRVTVRKLTSEPRAILSPLRTIGVSDARAAFATLVIDVAQGGKAITTRKPTGAIEQSIVQSDNPSQASKQALAPKRCNQTSARDSAGGRWRSCS